MPTSWLEFQGKVIERFGAQTEASWTSRRDFWSHIMTLEATILGLTAGLLGFTGDAPSDWLVWSWATLLAAILIGCVLMKVSLDLTEDLQREAFQISYELSNISGRVEAGELVRPSEEHSGLIIAAMIRHKQYGQKPVPWSEKALQTAKTYEEKLGPRLTNDVKRSPVQVWLYLYWQKLETVFYSASVVAFVFLILSATLQSHTDQRQRSEVPQLRNRSDSSPTPAP